MSEYDLRLANEAATQALGEKLGGLVRVGDVLALSGPLGAGKTALARGVVRALTGEAATSPTFSIVQTYETPDFLLWHFDLYRLEDIAEVWEAGLETALADGVSLIEWAERAAVFLPDTTLIIRIDPSDAPGARRARLRPGAGWGDRLAAFNPTEIPGIA